MSILELMKPDLARDLAWLRDALQAAVELEFFTIPPYLVAMWSITDEMGDAARTIREVVYEEMEHLALACNMLVAVGGTPQLNHPRAIPSYPRPLPGGVKPELRVGLGGLTPETVRVFMAIEAPETPIEFPEETIEFGLETFPTIGSFYLEIRDTALSLNPPIHVDRQVSGPLVPWEIGDLDAFVAAIDRIRVQGEGTDVSPSDETPSDLAHFYRFQELDKGRKLVLDPATMTYHWGPDLPFPDTFPVAPIPAGGYRAGDVSAEVAAHLGEFDRAYSRMLDALQSAWDGGGPAGLLRATEWMFSLRDHARALMEHAIPGTDGLRYGPCFRYVAHGCD